MEHKVTELYSGLSLGEDDLLAIQEDFRRELEQRREKSGPAIARAKRQINQLELQRRRVARGVVDGSIPPDLAWEEQERIARELIEHRRTIATADQGFEVYEKPFQLVLDLVADCEAIYTRGDRIVRRLMNQLFFDRVLKDPWYTIRRHAPDLHTAAASEESSRDITFRLPKVVIRTSRPNRSNKEDLVPPTGFEPVLPP